MSKALSLVQITVEQQDFPFLILFLTIKYSSLNISKTLWHRFRLNFTNIEAPIVGKNSSKRFWKNSSQCPEILLQVKLGNGVISLLWQLRCHCNHDHNKVSSLSNATVVSIFPNLCLWRRSLRSNVGGIDLEKLYRATLRERLVLNMPKG